MDDYKVRRIEALEAEQKIQMFSHIKGSSTVLSTRCGFSVVKITVKYHFIGRHYIKGMRELELKLF